MVARPANVVESLLDVMRDGNEYGSIVDLRPATGNLVPEFAEQVTLFVDAIRAKFQSVEFILPYKAMSAGTLWALSGERIWMDRRACIGPVDPQVPSSDNRLVPAQALLTLLDKIQSEGDAALKQKQNPPWAYIRLLDRMDQRHLGAALSSTRYIEDIASKYLRDYKFSTWNTHSSNGQAVTSHEREDRAKEVAKLICSHERWKAHGHAINREIAFSELKVKVDSIETVPGLERAVRRLWALFYYIFDKSAATKIMLSREYSYIRNLAVQSQPGEPR